MADRQFAAVLPTSVIHENSMVTPHVVDRGRIASLEHREGRLVASLQLGDATEILTKARVCLLAVRSKVDCAQGQVAAEGGW